MSSRTRQHAPERPRPRHREPSYDSYDSYTDSSDEDSYSSESDDDRRRRSRKSSTPKQQQPNYKIQSSNSTALTKTPAPVPSHRRRAVSEDRRKSRGRKSRYYDSDSDSYDSEQDSETDDTDDDDEYADKGDMSVASSSYNKNKNKSRMEQRVDSILDALGLLHIKRDPSQRQLSSPDPEKYAKQKQALQAAVTAAAIEAWRSHSKPGGFNLNKAIRVAIAAIAAGGMDVLVDSHPGHESLKDVAEAIVGGLATSKALGGKITHRREGGAQGKMIDGFIALAASKMVKPPKPDEVERRKKNYNNQRSKSVEPSGKRSSRSH